MLQGTNPEASKAGADARWSTSTSLKRALALIQEGNWIEALKNLTALTDRAAQQDSTAPATNPDPDAVTAALLRICRLKLGLAPTEDAGVDKLRNTKLAGGRGAAKNAAKPSSVAAVTQPPLPKAMLTASGADNHPAEHLAAAMTAALPQGSTAGPSPSATQLLRQRADAARCVGCALTYLLHPAGSQLPAALREEAFTLLREFGGLMVGPKLGPAAGLNGGGGAGGDDRTADPTHWQEHAKRSPALSKLLKLTGLTPVKRAMFEVAAAVGRHPRLSFALYLSSTSLTVVHVCQLGCRSRCVVSTRCDLQVVLSPLSPAASQCRAALIAASIPW